MSQRQPSCATALSRLLDLAAGDLPLGCYRRHRHAEFIAFLEFLAKRYPKLELHLICDKLHRGWL